MFRLIESNLGAITLLLAFATLSLAISTRQLAVATKSMFDIEARPYLVFNKPMFRIVQAIGSSEGTLKVMKQTVRLGVEFKNSGRVPVTYSVTRIQFTLEGQTVDAPEFTTRGGTIYPSGFGVFWYGTIPFDKAFVAPKSGVIEYDVTFWSSDHGGRYRKQERLRYLVTSVDPYTFDWSYIEDSTEERA